MRTSYRKQKGLVLVVAMIMLILMTLMALATFNLGRSSLDVIGNMQQSQAVVNAANVAIQEAMSTRRMFQSPASIFAVPCPGYGPNTRCVDVNGDSVNDILVSLTPTPTCIQSRQILGTELDFSIPDDRGCIVQSNDSPGIVGAGMSSLCAASLWEINAVSRDLVTNASVTVTQGAAVRVGINDVASACP